MANFIIVANRKSIYPKFSSGKVEIPIGPRSSIYRENIKPLFYGNLENVTDELRDFIEIASIINYADRYVLRGEREQWCRNIEIHISVRSLTKFNMIKTDLELCLNILGGDNVSFVVDQLQEKDRDILPSRKKKRKKETQELLNSLTDIVLISGGQDSSIASFDYFQKGKVPFFVRINTHDKANPRDILKKSNKARVPYFYLNQECSSIDGPRFNTESISKETSQRLRSYYFLAIATSLAATTGLKEININENGIMGIHLPLDISRSSTFSTRTAYPPYLAVFAEIVSRWLEIANFKVRNKWILKTKNEVIKSGLDSGIEAVVFDSVSCAHAAIVQNVAKIHKKKASYVDSDGKDLHCGYCFPCILRRISMASAGVIDRDVNYLMNPFGDMIVDADSSKFNFLQESKSAILSLIRFSKYFLESADSQVLIDYPQLYECALGLGDLNFLDDLIQLHRRFANEVYNYIKVNSPLLLFLFNDEKSRSVDKIINSVATLESMNSILTSFKVGEWNELFERELTISYSLVRYRVLIALGNDLIDEYQLTSFFERALESILPHRAEEREKIKLNQRNGRELKAKILKDCNCPPITGRRTG